MHDVSVKILQKNKEMRSAILVPVFCGGIRDGVDGGYVFALTLVQVDPVCFM